VIDNNASDTNQSCLFFAPRCTLYIKKFDSQLSSVTVIPEPSTAALMLLAVERAKDDKANRER